MQVAETFTMSLSDTELNQEPGLAALKDLLKTLQAPSATTTKAVTKKGSKASRSSSSSSSKASVLEPFQLMQHARLDTCVTVVDAATFHDNLTSIEDLRDRWAREAAGGGDVRWQECG
jgi:hypothetical protein